MFDLPMFTLVHVVISVLGIVSGLVVVGGFLSGRQLTAWITLFLLTTIATSVTGFGFPFRGVAPPHIFGVISLIALALALLALYAKNLQGRWRSIFVVTSVLALYLNVFVLIVQLFTKTPAIAALVPTQKEAPFLITQLLGWALFLWLGRSSLRNFRPGYRLV
jgi:hypothetical protein